MKLHSIFALFLTACASTAAPSKPPAATAKSEPAMATKSQSPKVLPIPADLEEPIRQSSSIGLRLYVLDKVSAMATDVMFANVPDPRSSGIRGYLPIPEFDPDGNQLTSFRVFFFNDATPPRILCETRIALDKKPEFQAYDPPRPADDTLVALIRARQLAIAARPKTAQPVNPVLMPAEANGEEGILVYLLAGTDKPNVAVLGQHFRALVPMDASKVSYMMPLSKSILELPTRAPDGETIEALTVTHIVTDFPLETHVFVSLQMKLPIFVVTKRGLWFVNGDKISFLGDKMPE